ncbi:protein YLS3 [Cinnamomum micranthum f. kanehirae]|uniref:Protein YLS3 n=1 Tax=Cinnamomum micranthum f. kanehirae TaxID=337451 RepID=A0A443PDV9_9MAGN|nr:protein YLS3 [Cinnamomum micranthum f. kanehirae]
MKLSAATSMALLVVALLGLQRLLAADTVAEMGKCTNVMVALSPCLPYMASAPNNRSSSPSPFCCRPFRASASSRVSGNRNETCLCYLVRNPSLFGFPVDAERIASLVSICHLKSRKTPDAYLRSLCRGSPTAPAPQSNNGSASLPPVGSPTGSPTFPPPNHNGSFTFPPMGSPTGSSPPQNHNGSVTLPPVGSPTGFRTSPPPQKHNGSSTSPPMRSPPGSPTLHPPQRHRGNASSNSPPPQGHHKGSKTAPPPRSSTIVPGKSSSRPTTTTVRNSSCQFSPGLFTMLFLVFSITLVITILAQHSH